MLQYLEVKKIENSKIQSSAPEKEWKSDTMIFKIFKIFKVKVQAVERGYAFPFHKYHRFTQKVYKL